MDKVTNEQVLEVIREEIKSLWRAIKRRDRFVKHLELLTLVMEGTATCKTARMVEITVSSTDY